jgi:hypothetical protein
VWAESQASAEQRAESQEEATQGTASQVAASQVWKLAGEVFWDRSLVSPGKNKQQCSGNSKQLHCSGKRSVVKKVPMWREEEAVCTFCGAEEEKLVKKVEELELQIKMMNKENKRVEYLQLRIEEGIRKSWEL